MSINAHNELKQLAACFEPPLRKVRLEIDRCRA